MSQQHGNGGNSNGGEFGSGGSPSPNQINSIRSGNLVTKSVARTTSDEEAVFVVAPTDLKSASTDCKNSCCVVN